MLLLSTKLDGIGHKFAFFLVSAGYCFDRDVDYIDISLIVILKAKTQYHARQHQELKSLCISNIIYTRGKQFPDSDLVEFLSGSTDSAINFSGSADLHTPIHPPSLACLSVQPGVLADL